MFKSGYLTMVLPSTRSSSIPTIDDCFCLAYEYVEEGTLLSKIQIPVSEETAFRIGAAVGELNQRIAHVSREPRETLLEWNFSQFSKLFVSNQLFVPSETIIYVKNVFSHFERISPDLPLLPHQVCHNDCNEDNILVSVSGVSIIDYCDVDYVPRVYEIAILCTYLIGQFLRCSGKVEVGEMVEKIIKPALAGFNSTAGSLTESELRVFPILTLSRAAMSILIQSKHMHVSPSNAQYLGSSMQRNIKFLRLVSDFGIENFLKLFSSE